MPTVGSIEKKIERVEGFKVHLLYPHGQNIRSDQESLHHNYSFKLAASGEITVSQWRESRFQREYPGFRVEVLFGNGQVANGNTKLANVRASY